MKEEVLTFKHKTNLLWFKMLKITPLITLKINVYLKKKLVLCNAIPLFQKEFAFLILQKGTGIVILSFFLRTAKALLVWP